MAIVKEVEDNSRYHLSTKFVGVAFDHYDQGSSRKRVRLSEEEKEKKAANANVSVNANLNVDANVNVNENETENEGLEKKDEENQREEGLRTEKETRGKPAGEGNASERSDTQSVP